MIADGAKKKRKLSSQSPIGSSSPLLIRVMATTKEAMFYTVRSADKCVGLAISLFLPLILLLPAALLAQSRVDFFPATSYAGQGNIYFADFNGDGKLDILTGDGTTQLGNGNGTFTTGVKLTDSTIAVGDFNGDGKSDVLEQDFENGTPTLQLGNGDGTFQPPLTTDLAPGLTSVVAVDLNGDGMTDVVQLLSDQTSLTVFLSIGGGIFAQGVSYSSHSPSGGFLLGGDFNNDGKPDLALLSTVAYNVPGQVVVLLGNVDGTLNAAISSSTVGSPTPGALGDFNGDGKMDIIVQDFFGAGTFLQMGNGDGTFQPPTSPLFPDYGALSSADFNRDGKLDLIVCEVSWCKVFLGTGNGTFAPSYAYVTGQIFGSPLAAAIADLNGDGEPDIAAENFVLLGIGDGSFKGQTAIPTPVAVNQSTLGDFDNDGKTDVAVMLPDATNDIYILKNDGTGSLTIAQTYSLQQPSYAIVNADFNGDGNLDLLVVGTDAASQKWGYSVLLGNGDGTFRPPLLYPQSLVNGATQYSIVVADFNADFNNDTRVDAAITMWGATEQLTAAVLLGNGDGTFAPPSYVSDGGAFTLVSADLMEMAKPIWPHAIRESLPPEAVSWSCWETGMVLSWLQVLFPPAIVLLF